MQQACKDPINKELVPEESVSPIQVARQVTIPAMSESAVLDSCAEATIMSVHTHKNLKGQRSALVEKETAEVRP